MSTDFKPGQGAPIRITALAALLALSACGGSDDDTRPIAESCTTLAGKTLGNGSATITAAELQAATPATGATAQAMPAYCKLSVAARDTGLKMGLWLPTEGWNGKLLMQGGGGFDGAIAAPTANLLLAHMSPSVVGERYAVMATNGGHEAAENANGAFALDATKLQEFAQTSEHRALPWGKELVNTAYGKAPTRSYFEGCSMGGHDAMMLSQRYPEDFDGIVARAPAGNIMGLFPAFSRLSITVRNPANRLTPAKQTLVADAALAQCDGLDGLADGIISKPAACQPNLSALRCAGGADAGDGCLSDAQLATVALVTSPYASADGAYTHPGYNHGLENSPVGWGQYIWPNAAGQSVQGGFADGFVRGFITRDLAYDTNLWNPNDWLPRMAEVATLFQAFNPDLSGMRARNAKLIMWNGTNDSSVTSRDMGRYYQATVARMGQAAVDQTLEAFEAPGVGHCGGGPGADHVDLVKSLDTWVTAGTPPSSQNLVQARKTATGDVALTRPLCKYPTTPRYKGTGDVNSAASFACVSD
ncbi:tannase/feruloyl esterase family alpha/beta hydrolase [Pseudorhodoferax sp. Leaf267]|uniref:tannase/feruloyl esterase family alpha/beta hydrolase n=1 Tax=Pseudorhodoferax sp. Leaf267 TaxID=1736316 RepID=UPI0006F478B4|nr:tannase/feruloyl esterase family alpha/beta hydrolase [Pseudorhodoferax sp. Leaf267]KQP22947.1 tannase [Pseudorhodoferax sp. Leaf267]